MLKAGTGDAAPEIVPLPLDTENLYAIEAVRLLLTEIWRYGIPAYVASQEDVVAYIQQARMMKAGKAAIYAMIDPETARVIAAADVSHNSPDDDGPPITCTYISKIAVDPSARRSGNCRRMLMHVDQEAKRRGDVNLRLHALMPEVFQACGFMGPKDNMVANVGSLGGLEAS